MGKRRIYKVTDSFGGVHTRSTERTYTHAVLVRDRLVDEIAQAWESYAWARRQNNLERIAEGDARIAELQAQYSVSPDGLEPKWDVLGWCGRHDLAEKLIAANRKGSRQFAAFAIVEVNK